MRRIAGQVGIDADQPAGGARYGPACAVPLEREAISSDEMVGAERPGQQRGRATSRA